MRLDEITPEYSGMRRVLALCAPLVLLLAGTAFSGDRPSRQSRGTISREYYDARALFEKVWEPGEAPPGGGDGLGPLFNERSCVRCHNLGGTGGAGDNTKNVTILSALAGASVVGNNQEIFQGELEELHPGFRNHSSIVLHLHSTSTTEESRLAKIRSYAFVQTRDDIFTLSGSQRSSPALFGAGRINAIPDNALLAAEARTFPAFPEIKGRVSKLRGGRLGKFGWKGQTASLEDFVMAACANELGLEVRGHHQSSLLSPKEFDPKKISLDLSNDECSQMIRFVANLPAPIVRDVKAADWGLRVFEVIGCAACHAPNLGGVSGLYSDLLLHDLGDRFRASAADTAAQQRQRSLIDQRARETRCPPGSWADRNGGRPHCGESPTPPLTFTMDAPQRFTKPSSCTAAKPNRRRSVMHRSPSSTARHCLHSFALRSPRHSPVGRSIETSEDLRSGKDEGFLQSTGPAQSHCVWALQCPD